MRLCSMEKHDFSTIYSMKGSCFVVIISEQEKKVIAQAVPDVHIRRTVKQKSKRHRYYMEENAYAMRILRSLRAAV